MVITVLLKVLRGGFRGVKPSDSDFCCTLC